jgi:hypothetical protein
VFDFESSGPKYKQDVQNTARRLEVSAPTVPAELEVYLEHDDSLAPATAKLLSVVQSKDLEVRFDLLEEALERKPNALTIIDPLEMLFRIDTGKKANILWLYSQLRVLLARYPQAALLFTFNMRKQDRKGGQGLPDLLRNPRAFLEEVCGSLDILNRSDVRLGMNLYGTDDARVINGIRRSEDFHPLIVHPVGDTGNLSGFELVTPTNSILTSAFKGKQLGYWTKLPPEFSWEEVTDKIVPQTTLSRLIRCAKSIGALSQDETTKRYRKTAIQEDMDLVELASQRA